MCNENVTNSILFLFPFAFNQQLILKQPKDVVTIFKSIDPLRPYQEMVKRDSKQNVTIFMNRYVTNSKSKNNYH